MAFKGIQASNLGLWGDKPTTLADYIRTIAPDGDTPLFGLSSMMKNVDIDATEHTWAMRGFNQHRVELTSHNGAASGNTYTVTDTSAIIQGQIGVVESTGEYWFIVGVTANTITVVRGFSNTGVTALSATPESPKYLQILTTAFEEGSDAPVSFSEGIYQMSNNVQIVRDSYALTGTAAKTKHKYTSNPLETEKAQAVMRHNRSLEQAFLWGKKAIGKQNGQTLRTMDGIVNQIKTNVFVCPNTGLTLDLFMQWIEAIFMYKVDGMAPDTRMCLCSNHFLMILNKLILEHGTYQLIPLSTEWGMTVTELVTTSGRVFFKTHPLMNVMPLYRNDVYIIHPSAVEFYWLRRSIIGDSILKNGKDAESGGVLSECGVAVTAEICCGKIIGVEKADV